MNTPRFSERMREQNKESNYQKAMQKISNKRRKVEEKRQLYTSMKGKKLSISNSAAKNKEPPHRYAGQTKSYLE